MATFMDYAERTQAARVVLVGDSQQLDAVAAGQPFAQLQKAGMRIAVMDEIRRQRDSDLRAAVYHSIRGEIKDAFERLADYVQETPDPHQEAAQRYLALSPAKRQSTRVLTLTNAARAEINDAVRAGLRAEGSLAEESTSVSGLTNRRLTEAELADARSYASGDVVMSLVTSCDHGLRKSNLYVACAVNAKRNSLSVEHETDGTRRTLPLAATFNRRALGKSFVAYEREARDLVAGDMVRFRISDPENGVTNGVRSKITATSDGIIAAQTAEGKRLEIDRTSLAARGLEHDYAATTHAVQGESVNRVIVAMRATEQLVSQKSFYVEISRARDQAMLLTDDPERLAATVQKESGTRPAQLDRLSVCAPVAHGPDHGRSSRT